MMLILKRLKKSEKRDQESINIAQVKFKEIEKQVRRYTHERAASLQKRVTQLDNQGAGVSAAGVQKELLKGRYSVKLQQEMPYNHKMIFMAQEPCSYQLFKKRDFHQFTEEGMAILNTRKTFKDFLLKVGNAELAGLPQIDKVVSQAVQRGFKLSNHLSNLPPDLELGLRQRVKAGVLNKDQGSKFFQKRNEKKTAQEHDIPDSAVYYTGAYKNITYIY